MELDTLDLTRGRADQDHERRGRNGRLPAEWRTRLYRSGKVILQVFASWGILIAVIVTVLVLRHNAEAQARAPLPPPAVQLSSAETNRWQAFPAYHGVIPVLLYYGINPGKHQSQLFAQQMLALRTAGFHAITLAQYVSFAYGHHGGLPSKPILLTFDEGRLDTYRVVNNILQKYGFHATMFTFATWPTSDPRTNLTWAELQNMEQSGTWSVQENGGSPSSVIDSTAAKSRILWGVNQFDAQLPGFKPLAFAVPSTGSEKQQQLSGPQIHQLMVPWLRHYFWVVFGGDYLEQGAINKHKITARSLPTFSYRIPVDSTTSLRTLDCRLRDWVTGKPVWREWRCLRYGSAASTDTYQGG